MNITKKLISVLLILVMALSFAACTAPADEGEIATDITVNETVYPVTVTDQAGRSVTIESQPEKLISGYYISTSALIALGLSDKLVGVEAKASTRPIYSLSAPHILNLPSVGTAKAFDLEGALALSPDLVILPLKLKDTASTLEEMGIDVLLVNPENQALSEEMIALIGKAANKNAEADALLATTSQLRTMLEESLKDSSSPSVYLAGNSSFLSTAGSAMYQSSMIELAGGNNVASSITDTYWAEISYEQLLAWDPEYIILASDADYSVEDVLNDPNLVNSTAVKNGNVHQLPGKAESWDSPVPGGILGSVWLSGVLHPDVCSEENNNAWIDLFYETFYSFTYSEN